MVVIKDTNVQNVVDPDDKYTNQLPYKLIFTYSPANPNICSIYAYTRMHEQTHI